MHWDICWCYALLFNILIELFVIYWHFFLLSILDKGIGWLQQVRGDVLWTSFSPVSRILLSFVDWIVTPAQNNWVVKQLQFEGRRRFNVNNITLWITQCKHMEYSAVRARKYQRHNWLSIVWFMLQSHLTAELSYMERINLSYWRGSRHTVMPSVKHPCTANYRSVVIRCPSP